jgi:hypothetical protein
VGLIRSSRTAKVVLSTWTPAICSMKCLQREPSRVLEVTVCRVYYPITEEIFSQIFDPSARVGEVFLCKELEYVDARVIFPSKLDATEALGEFHGRHIYDGYCQMMIRWRIFQECFTTAGMTFTNTMKSTSCKPL